MRQKSIREPAVAATPRRRSGVPQFVTLLLAFSLLNVGLVGAFAVAKPHHHATVPTSGAASVVGVSDASEPSGMAPPPAHILPGFVRTYVNDFSGSSVPSGWDVYSGVPGGDPGGQFGSGHVAVFNGELQLSAWSDPAYGGAWVTGGLCHCGLSRTYGAYFVRVRDTGPGPTAVALLWPVAHVWPPEVDFLETDGNVTSSTATAHWGSSNNKDQNSVAVDLTKWHTFGVIWTPGQLSYVIDGRVYATVNRADEIPNQPMTLDLQQQTWCLSSWACPSSPQALKFDWVAEYSFAGSPSVDIGPMLSTNLTSTEAQQIQSLATDATDLHCNSIALTAYDPAGIAGGRNAVTLVAQTLRHDLAARGATVAVSEHVVKRWRGLHAALQYPSGHRRQVLGRACAK